ncbi:MAG: hypothetical protein D6704_13630 [Nitrospirae bacterium]|nr:MAG: hypothetical protein D6704_13630 [Nitrospirota bacterium]
METGRYSFGNEKDTSLSPQPESEHRPYWGEVPPGLQRYSTRLIHYLPEIYRPFREHTGVGAPMNGDFGRREHTFLSRFLAIFESILLPIEWTVDGFDLFLHARTTPKGFLYWLAGWFALTFDPGWDEARRRQFLVEASNIYARRGTKWALQRVLEVYTGVMPEIVDDTDELPPHTFIVRLPLRKQDVNVVLVEKLIESHKPAHTTWKLQWRD